MCYRRNLELEWLPDKFSKINLYCQRVLYQENVQHTSLCTTSKADIIKSHSSLRTIGKGMSDDWITSTNGRYNAQIHFYDQQGGYVRVSPPFYNASLVFLEMHAGPLFIEKWGTSEESNPYVYVTTNNATVLRVNDSGVGAKDFKTQAQEFAQSLVDELDKIDSFGNPDWISLAKEVWFMTTPPLFIRIVTSALESRVF
jgi:hypothetical protein